MRAPPSDACRLDSGEALFDVAKNPRRPFIVTAGDRQVVALGTSFVVRRQERQVTVTLIEGKVAVTPVAETSNPSEKTVLMPESTPRGREHREAPCG